MANRVNDLYCFLITMKGENMTTATAIAVMKDEKILGYYLADDQDLVSRMCDAKLYAKFNYAQNDMTTLSASWSLAEGERFVPVTVKPRALSTNWAVVR